MNVEVPLAGVAVVAALAAAAVPALSAAVRDHTRRLVVDYGVFAVFGASAVVGVWLFLNRDQEFFRVLLARYWLVALFAVFVLEGAMLMYFAPSELLVPIAVGMAANTDVAPGTPAVFALVVGVSVVAATVGQYLLFLVAKRWGRERLLERPWFRVSDGQLARFERWFNRWGQLAVPVSNTLLFTRGMLTVPAGLAEMPDRRFVLLSALGTLTFETVLALAALGVLELGIV